MTYRALYREWRPQTFADLVGQEHVRRILTNALAAGRVSHAYLFCGPRGTGKTSTAKILAKALNCTHGPTSEPCNQCPACTRITAGDFLDVLEIDGASNRGIDEIRELREKVQLAPAEGRYKVYIIDEVHMLTTEAFNALLRTLEEPPAHVIFIFATTEAHKIPLTILSRCQRLDFHRLALPAIVERLQEVAACQGVAVEERTLFLLAKKAEGSLRDALSLLDQCISLGTDKIDHDEVLAVLGAAAGEELQAMVDCLVERDVTALLQAINRLLDFGRDPRQLIRDLIGYFRNLLLFKAGAGQDGLVEATAEEKQVLSRQAAGFSTPQLMSGIELLAATEGEVRWDSQPRVCLEVMAIKLLQELTGPERKRQEALAPQEPLPGEAPSGLGHKAGKPEGPAPKKEEAPVVGAPPGKGEGDRAVKKPPAAQKPTPTGAELSLTAVQKKWPEVLEELKKSLDVPGITIIQAGEPVEVKENRLTLAFSHQMPKEKVTERYKNQIEAAMKEIFGRELHLRCVLVQEENKSGAETGNDLVQRTMEFFGPELVEVKEENLEL